jgi:hypothetical protein
LSNSELIDFTLVIPTLGERSKELQESLKAISSSGLKCDLIIVTPKAQIEEIDRLVKSYCAGYQVKVVIENEYSSLPKAINQGLALVRTEYWNWVGDDDKVHLAEVKKIVMELSLSDSYALGVGSCRYFSSNTSKQIINDVRHFSAFAIFWGPNLIPQPSVVFRTEMVRTIGGINTNYLFAFDQDLITKCLKRGKILVHRAVSSEYRWSQDTLTSKNRSTSLSESHQIRLENAESNHQKLIVNSLYPLVVLIVRISDLVFKFKFQKRIF